MGNEKHENASLTPMMLALKRARKALVTRMAQADAFVLEAAAVTLSVTLHEEGAAPGTFSTISLTCWGMETAGWPKEAMLALVNGHFGRAAQLEEDQLRKTLETIGQPAGPAEAAEGGADAEKPPES